jgi:DUF2892 family protein
MSFVNEATWDRILRIALGVGLLYLGWAGVVGGALGAALKIVGFLPLVTGVLGYCPAYSLLGIATCPRRASTP